MANIIHSSTINTQTKQATTTSAYSSTTPPIIATSPTSAQHGRTSSSKRTAMPSKTITPRRGNWFLTQLKTLDVASRLTKTFSRSTLFCRFCCSMISRSIRTMEGIMRITPCWYARISGGRLMFLSSWGRHLSRWCPRWRRYGMHKSTPLVAGTGSCW